MKKNIIMGTSAILAVLPMTGAFAATGTVVTDTIQVTVDTSCNINSSTAAINHTYTKTMINGSLRNSDSETDPFETTTMRINCNDAGGWTLSAIGSSDPTDKNVMIGSTGSNISTGTNTGGNNASSWAFKVNGTGSVSSYNNYTYVPSSAQTVASGSTVADNDITAKYQVWIGKTQQAGTYTGKVTYTLSYPSA